MKRYIIMKAKTFIVLLIFLSLGGNLLSQNKTNNKIALTKVYSKYKLNPKSSLESRIGRTSNGIIEKFRQAGMNPSHHKLTKRESEIVSEALEKIPLLHRQVLKKYLSRISFLDNMPNTALTAPINPKDSLKLYSITIRAEILHQTISEWLTEKEKSCFNFSNSDLNIKYNAGNLNALVYILIHEATHIVDAALRIYSNNPNPTLSEVLTKNPFTKGIWDDRLKVNENYQSKQLDKIYFKTGKPLPASHAQAIYKELSNSPFVSLYARNSCHEDFAEFITISYLAEKIGQEFSVELKMNEQTIFTFKPLKSNLVKKRLNYIKQYLPEISK